jgi:hypothetical protein
MCLDLLDHEHVCAHINKTVFITVKVALIGTVVVGGVIGVADVNLGGLAIIHFPFFAAQSTSTLAPASLPIEATPSSLRGRPRRGLRAVVFLTMSRTTSTKVLSLHPVSRFILVSHSTTQALKRPSILCFA